MECKIITVSDDECRFEREINNFIKNKTNCQVSVSSTTYFGGRYLHTKFVACITYPTTYKGGAIDG